MMNISSLTLTRDDGSQVTVTIEPVFVTFPETRYFTGVYRMLETDMPGKELGEVAFHLDDPAIWEFTEDHFSMGEQEQIVNFIRDKELFDGATFTETIAGGTHHFRITDNEGHFGVEKDGILIGVIEHREDWRQTEGEPLSGELFYKIVSKIEGRKD